MKIAPVVVPIYPGMSFHDLEFSMLIVLLRPSENPDWWETLVMDRDGGYDLLQESVHTVRHLVSNLNTNPKVVQVY